MKKRDLDVIDSENELIVEEIISFLKVKERSSLKSFQDAFSTPQRMKAKKILIFKSRYLFPESSNHFQRQVLQSSYKKSYFLGLIHPNVPDAV
ncbi:hypothetical protein LCGC14_3084810 [marine sediment metagenome]|uniref:Uncharacterized protein n=1 Tax=marine sediment metagenome TaxID=412755 RepID=A0A0F8WD15_9ZZZZ